jgi:hypothetical protein
MSEITLYKKTKELLKKERVLLYIQPGMTTPYSIRISKTYVVTTDVANKELTPKLIHGIVVRMLEAMK